MITPCQWGLEYADYIPCRVVRFPVVSWVWHEIASDIKVLVLGIWGV